MTIMERNLAGMREPADEEKSDLLINVILKRIRPYHSLGGDKDYGPIVWTELEGLENETIVALVMALNA
jgi:hypothetical protein